MKWTKFSTGEYPTNIDAFVTNYEDAWVVKAPFNWNKFADENPQLAWAEIELPEVPKRELHRCDSVHECSYCEETETGLKFVAFDNCEKVSINCRFCPFCGYSIKEKE